MTRSHMVSAFLLTLALLPGAGCGDHDHDSGASAGGGHKHGSKQGGVAVELGEHQFQLDVLHDPAAGVLTAWVMDGHMENFIRIPAPSLAVTVKAGGTTNTVSLQAIANAATGETVGNTSQFRGEADWLKGLTQFQATVDVLEVRGSRFQSVSFSYPEPR